MSSAENPGNIPAGYTSKKSSKLTPIIPISFKSASERKAFTRAIAAGLIYSVIVASPSGVKTILLFLLS